MLYLSLNIMRCISAELLYTYQTVGVCIREWFPDEATTDDTALYVVLTKIGTSYEI